MLSLFSFLALLLLAVPVRAQIGIQDAQSPLYYNNSSSLNTSTFTVSATSQYTVLVVNYGSRAQGTSPPSDPKVPTTLYWNGYPLTLAAWTNGTASTWDDNGIYYLVNPPSGTGSVTGTLSSYVNQSWWSAYTITNVAGYVNPLAGAVGQNGGTQAITNTVNGVYSGSWAAVNASISSANETLTINGPSGSTALTDTGTSGNTTQTSGSISNCPAGSGAFYATNSGSGNKQDLVEAIFSPLPPLETQPPGQPTWVSVTTSAPGQVDLTWTDATNATYYELLRGPSSGDYTVTNVLVGNSNTNYVDTSVFGNLTYYYGVVAVNNISSNSSVETNATPTSAPVNILENPNWTPTVVNGPDGGRDWTYTSGINGKPAGDYATQINDIYGLGNPPSGTYPSGERPLFRKHICHSIVL